MHVTAADEQDRAQVKQSAAQVQDVAGASVQAACVDQGETSDQPGREVATHGLPLKVVKLPEAKRDFVLWPRRWSVERSFAWAACFRRLARDDERWLATLAGFHVLAFMILLLKRFVGLMAQSA